MIIVKSKDEIEMMKVAGVCAGEMLRDLRDVIKPGISTMEIDACDIKATCLTETFQPMGEELHCRMRGTLCA